MPKENQLACRNEDDSNQSQQCLEINRSINSSTVRVRKIELDANDEENGGALYSLHIPKKIVLDSDIVSKVYL